MRNWVSPVLSIVTLSVFAGFAMAEDKTTNAVPPKDVQKKFSAEVENKDMETLVGSLTIPSPGSACAPVRRACSRVAVEKVDLQSVPPTLNTNVQTDSPRQNRQIVSPRPNKTVKPEPRDVIAPAEPAN